MRNELIFAGELYTDQALSAEMAVPCRQPTGSGLHAVMINNVLGSPVTLALSNLVDLGGYQVAAVLKQVTVPALSAVCVIVEGWLVGDGGWIVVGDADPETTFPVKVYGV